MHTSGGTTGQSESELLSFTKRPFEEILNRSRPYSRLIGKVLSGAISGRFSIELGTLDEAGTLCTVSSLDDRSSVYTMRHQSFSGLRNVQKLGHDQKEAGEFKPDVGMLRLELISGRIGPENIIVDFQRYEVFLLSRKWRTFTKRRYALLLRLASIIPD